METNAQHTGDGPGIADSATARSFLTAVLVLVAAGLAVGLFVFGPRITAGEALSSDPNATQIAAVPSASESAVRSADAATLYQAFVCPCCGDDIGSCSCGMAEERRSVVDEHVAQGASQRQVYQAMFQRYGAEAFFDQALAADVRSGLLAELPAQRPVLVVEPSQIHLGQVPISDKLVSATFTVTNAGQSDLIITGMETTCGCTTAVLETSQGTSPVFGGTSAGSLSDWSAVLAPGEEALLVATMDLMFHGPEATGKFQRGISVISNDPLNSRVDVSFVVEVTK